MRAKGNVRRVARIWKTSRLRSAAGRPPDTRRAGGREAGWEEVRGSFEQVAQLASGGHGELRDQSIQVGGDLAYEVGIEQGQITLAGEQIAIEHRVTNVYRREAGGWKIVHHHTDLSAAMLNLLSRLQAA